MNYTVGDKHDLCKCLMKEGILTEYVSPETHEDWEDLSSTQQKTEVDAEKKEEWFAN